MKNILVLIDLSGTLHIEDSAIPRAVESLEKLRRFAKIRFVTNTTKESKNRLYDRLQKLGFQVEKEEIFSSLSAAKSLIIERSLRPFLIIDDEAMEDFDEIATTSPNAVVIGLATKKFQHQMLNEAFRLIKNDGAELIAIHKGRYYETKNGLELGPGAFVTGLEYSCDVKATIVGKPNEAFFRAAVANGADDNNISSLKVVMIGDDVNDDIIGAINAGISGILVQTGKYREGDELKIPEDKRNYASSFAEAVDMIICGEIIG